MSEQAFRYEPAEDYPGWFTWNLTDETRFNAQTMGRMLTRIEEGADGIRRARLRMFPERRHSNLLDAVHGGVTLALIDIALFAAMRTLLSGDAAGSVTLDLSSQFIGAGRIGEPLDAVTEVLRETGRLVFLRGLVVQGDDMIAAFNGTIRKPSPKKPIGR
ncbi:PaaI family thioesterase [Novosphingobium sp. CCH12-A3]|uniref:PaaI family thioesterase n=1 Tax=Novosphingobium sp. CCH12-A3 TaxID=1768752 RepID=UPI00078468BE|nr:PaaI family thioesterase [Novosphingobium sp. CCH12-A3]